jgi:hypothetical protein
MPTDSDFYALFGAIALGGALLVGGTYVAIQSYRGFNPLRNMPRDVNVAENFAKPSDLEITLGDTLPNTQGNETTLSYGEDNYFLRISSDGTLALDRCSVEMRVTGVE